MQFYGFKYIDAVGHPSPLFISQIFIILCWNTWHSKTLYFFFSFPLPQPLAKPSFYFLALWLWLFFVFNLCVSLCLKWVSCEQHTVGSCYLLTDYSTRPAQPMPLVWEWFFFQGSHKKVLHYSPSGFNNRNSLSHNPRG